MKARSPLRALATIVALVVLSSPLSIAADPPVADVVVFAEDSLPAATGWFLVPVTSAAPTRVSVGVQVSAAYEGPAPGGYMIIADSNATLPYTHGPVLWAGSKAQDPCMGALAAACCGPAESIHDGPLHLEMVTSITPTQPLYVGVVVVGWAKDANVEIEIVANDAHLIVGPMQTGTNARAVDLAREAMGSQLDCGGDTFPAAPADSSVGFTSDKNGLVTVAYAIEGQAQGNVEIVTPSGVIRSAYPSGVAGGYWGGFGVGTASVSLKGAWKPSALERPLGDDGRYDRIYAMALFADMPAPHQGAYVFSTR